MSSKRKILFAQCTKNANRGEAGRNTWRPNLQVGYETYQSSGDNVLKKKHDLISSETPPGLSFPDWINVDALGDSKALIAVFGGTGRKP